MGSEEAAVNEQHNGRRRLFVVLGTVGFVAVLAGAVFALAGLSEPFEELDASAQSTASDDEDGDGDSDEDAEGETQDASDEEADDEASDGDDESVGDEVEDAEERDDAGAEGSAGSRQATSSGSGPNAGGSSGSGPSASGSSSSTGTGTVSKPGGGTSPPGADRRGPPPVQPPGAAPPQAHDQSVETQQGSPVVITLTALTPLGRTPVFAIVDGPEHGEVSRDGAEVTYTPDDRFSGTDSFEFRASLGPLTDTATVTITVEQLPLPVAHDDDVTTEFQTPVTVTLGADAPSGGALTFAVDSEPGHGTVSIDGDEATYTPDAGFFGDDSFTFTADDGFNTSEAATVSVTVEQPAPPVAHDIDGVETEFETPVDIQLSGDAPSGEPLSFAIESQPDHGTATVDPATGLATYTPDPGFEDDDDTFTYTIDDGFNTSAPATVEVYVRPAPPTAADFHAGDTPYDTPITVTLQGASSSGQDLTYELVDDADDGSVTIDGDEATYTPDHGFAGQDSFTYRACDDFNCSDPATVTVTVEQPAAPVAHDIVGEETGFETSHDIDLSQHVDTFSGLPLTFMAVAQPANGTVQINGSIATYTPEDGFEDDDDSFTYQVNDGFNDSNVATVEVFVRPEPPTAADVSETTDQDAPVVMTLDGHSPGGHPLTYHYDQPSEGTVTGSGPDVTYTPDPGFHGTDTFTYHVNDGHTDSNTATVTVTIDPLPPVAHDIEDLDTPFETELDIDLSDHVDVPSGSANLTFSVVDQPDNGTVEINGSVATYEPDPGFEADTDTFTWRVNDSHNDSNVATVEVSVEPAPPTAQDVPDESTDQDTPVLITLLGNSSSGQTLTYHYDQPDDGTVTGAGPDVTYTPDPGFFGEDSFTYHVNDGLNDSNTATVTVTVNFSAEDYEFDAIGNTPLAVGVTGTGGPVVEATGGLLDDADPDFTVTDVDTNNGTVDFDEDDGTFTYLPDAGFSGTDTFQYTIENGDGVSGTGTVTIEVDEVVWYVDNDDDGDDDGRAGSPFQTLAAAEAASDEEEIIFLYAGSGAYTDGIALQDGQRLIGEGAGLTVGGHDLVDPGDRPEIDADGGDAIALAAGAQVGSLDITGATGRGIVAIDIAGCATVTDVTVSGATGDALRLTGSSEVGLVDVDITNSAGAAVSTDGLSGHLTHTGTITQAGIDTAVEITNLDEEGTVELDELTSAASGIVISGGDGEVTIASATLGSSGTRIDGESGLQLSGGDGTVEFGAFHAWTDGAPAIAADNAGTLTIAGGSVDAQDDSALFLDDLDADITLATATSTGSGGAGLHLDGVDGSVAITSGSVSGADGAALSITGGSLTLDADVDVTNTGGHGVNVTSVSGGDLTFEGAIADTGDGVSLSGNTGSTVAFTGELDLTVTGGDAFSATGGGTVTATGAGSTLSATGGRAIVVTGTAIGAAGLNFETVDASNAASGIVLSSAGTGPLVVAGDGSANRNGSGGTISGMSSHGVDASNAGPVTLSNMDIENNDGKGVRTVSTGGLTLAAANLVDNGDVHTNHDARNNVLIENATGTVAITDSFMSGSPHNQVDVEQTTGTVTINIERSEFHENENNSGVVLDIHGSATVTLNVDDSHFEGTHSSGVQSFAGGTSTMTVSVTDSTFVDNHHAVRVETQQQATATTTVSGNVANGHTSHTMHFASIGTSQHDLTVAGNEIDGEGTTSGSGINITAQDDSTLRAVVEDNTITEFGEQGGGVTADATGHTSTGDDAELHLTLRDNDAHIDTGSGWAYWVFAQGGAHTCAAISGNTGSSTAAYGAMEVAAFANSSVDIDGLTPTGPATLIQVEDYLEAQNPGLSIDAMAFTPGGEFFGVAAGTCEQP